MSLVSSQIAIYRRATGALEHLAPASLAPAASDPTFASVALPAGFDDSTFIWNATAKAMVEDLAKVKRVLVTMVKAEAERRKMLALSPGGAKKTEYDEKAREVLASATVLASALNALTKAAALQQYPMAWTEAQLTGEPLATVLTRYRSGMAAAMTEVRRVSAIEGAAVRAIDAAIKLAEARAAAAPNWTWTVP